MKSLKIFALAGMAVLLGLGAASAATTGDPCILINRLQYVFSTLRTLAFAGAAFVLGSWAWEFITSNDPKVMENVKKKGVGMFVGFTLLFSIGIIMQFLPNIGGCLPNW